MHVMLMSSTWRMMVDRGIDALVNECLIGPVLGMGATFVAYITALLCYLYLKFTKPAYNESGGYTPIIMALGFLIGLQITNTAVVPINSGVAAIFVCLGQSKWQKVAYLTTGPEVLRQTKPELYHAIVQAYPKVQNAVA